MFMVCVPGLGFLFLCFFRHFVVVSVLNCAFFVVVVVLCTFFVVLVGPLFSCELCFVFWTFSLPFIYIFCFVCLSICSAVSCVLLAY